MKNRLTGYFENCRFFCRTQKLTSFLESTVPKTPENIVQNLSKLVSSSLVTRICSKIHFWSPPKKGRITSKPGTPQGQRGSWVGPRRIPDKRTLQHSEKVTRFESYHRKYFHFRRKKQSKMATKHTLTTKIDHLEVENLKFSNVHPYFWSSSSTQKPPFHDLMYHVGFIRQFFNLLPRFSTLNFGEKILKKTNLWLLKFL